MAVPVALQPPLQSRFKTLLKTIPENSQNGIAA
jgi:hypothetical protein